MNHADLQRSIPFGNDDCPFCERTDEHEHQVKHIRRRELLHLVHGVVPLTHHPRQQEGGATPSPS